MAIVNMNMVRSRFFTTVCT